MNEIVASASPKEVGSKITAVDFIMALVSIEENVPVLSSCNTIDGSIWASALAIVCKHDVVSWASLDDVIYVFGGSIQVNRVVSRASEDFLATCEHTHIT